MPGMFTRAEYADMEFVYGYCDGNVRGAAAEYPRRRSGAVRPAPWPTRSPDLSPLDFFFWGCLKSRRRNEERGEKGDPRENPPTSGIVRHDSHMRNSGSNSAGNQTRFAQVGGK
ncbi:hypothetical protein PR048_027157 [Dryococelus australis]|uniref:Uncharacterized protein n=1 Tax=Dryococelus australis TaxID=614101 RepID=A0ABQ9GGK5_9NEOP|nr:hypothetical protein PR048_027157 [Dryococelus australis]